MAMDYDVVHPKKEICNLDLIEYIDMVTLSRYSVVNGLAPAALHKS